MIYKLIEIHVIKSSEGFKYLGAKFTSLGNSNDEPASRIGKTRAAVGQLNSLLCSTKISRQNKIRICKTRIKGI